MTQEIEAVGKSKEKKDGLTEMQAVFVENLSRGYSQGDAAKLAGYKHPDQNAYLLMKNNRVLEAIAANLRAKTHGLGGIALNGVYDLITNEATPAATKLNACKYVLDKIQEFNSLNEINALGNKDMNEMTAEELKAFVQSSRKVIMREIVAENE